MRLLPGVPSNRGVAASPREVAVTRVTGEQLVSRELEAEWQQVNRMHLIVIYNPTAGDGTWDAERVETLLQGGGYTVDMVSVKKAWRRRMKEEPDAFVACGGDGTVHKVMHALLGRSSPMAIVPVGTANNVAHALGYRTGDDIATRVQHWVDSEQVLYAATVEIEGRRRSYIESLGAGAFVKMRRKPDGSPEDAEGVMSLLGIRRALVKKLLAIEPMPVRATVDGATTQGEYLLLECMNLPYFGPRLRLAGEESTASPTVTLCGVPEAAREQAAQWIATGHGDVHDWTIARGSVVELEMDERTHVDGAIWPGKDARGMPIRITAGTHRLRVMV